MLFVLLLSNDEHMMKYLLGMKECLTKGSIHVCTEFKKKIDSAQLF